MREIKSWVLDFLEFIRAVISQWAVYATGGIIVAFLWLWSTLLDTPPSKKVNIGIALFFLFLAVFHAWRKQYRQRLILEWSKRKEDQKMGQILFISKFISDGQSLLIINPGEEAPEKEVKDWKSNVERWTNEVSSYLWAIGRTKFNDLMDVQHKDFHGAHKSVWGDLTFLEKRINNLKEIMEKREIYLAGMID